MASVITPSLPLTGPWLIDREDCIGDSLVNINANTNNFAYRLNQLRQPLNTQFIYVNDSTSAATFTVPTQWGGGTVSVTAGGNDTTGTGAASAPFKSLKKALEYVYSRDNTGGNNQIFIRLCPGNYVGCTIAGMPVGSGLIKGGTNNGITNSLGISNNIVIQGSGNTTTFITQFRVWTTGTNEPFVGTVPLWSHLYITDGAYITIDSVAFRYSTNAATNDQFVATAGAGTGTISYWHTLHIDNGSYVELYNTTFETTPEVYTNDNPQFTLGIYIRVFNRSTLFIRDITFNNGGYASRTTVANARYALQPYNSIIYMYGTITLLNGPRFTVFCEPSWQSMFRMDGANWSGNFGSQLGSGGAEGAFGPNDYQISQAKNYIVKSDGPLTYTVYRFSGTGNPGKPGNAFGSAYTIPAPDNNSYRVQAAV